MNQKLTPILISCMFLFMFFFVGCDEQTELLNSELVKKENAKAKEHELVDDFLLKLRNANVDTILFYKRTCVGCCDFYNIFWSSKGEHFLYKCYFDNGENMIVYVKLSDDKVFNVLRVNYNKLKSTTIKENIHKKINGDSIYTIATNYCYADFRIYTKQDSMITKFKDSDFDKYATSSKETNDYYWENKKSKWNEFVMVIENELAMIKETKRWELEHTRTEVRTDKIAKKTVD